MSRLIFSVAFAAVFLQAAGASSDESNDSIGWDEPLPAIDNAAVLYFQATIVMPAWNPEQQRLIDELDSVSADSVVCKEVFAASEHPMQLMRNAAELQRCDWGINWNDGPKSPPVLFALQKKLRALTRLARVRILFEARTGQLDNAVDDGLAVLALARHVGQGGATMNRMVDYAIETQGIAALADLVPRLNRKQLFQLSRRHAALPPRRPLSDAILWEKRASLGWLVRTVKNRGTKEALEFVAKIGGGSQPWFEPLENEALKDPKSFLILLDETAEFFDEEAQLMKLPVGDFSERSTEFSTRVAEHPLGSLLLAQPAGLYGAKVRADARHAMLQAALAYRFDGEKGLTKHLEPITGKPFTLRPTMTGFELRAEHEFYGNDPLVIHFGPPPNGN